MHDVQAVIFSKDRPLQLDGTLRSFRRHCRDADGVVVRVLFTASSSRSRAAYRQLMREHPEVRFVEEVDFRRDLLLLLGLHEFVLVVVDDCLFVRDFALDECAAALRARPAAIGCSLRLGRNTTFCYSRNQPQEVPALETVSAGLCAVEWPGKAHDFGYPLEVSSSLYRAADLLPLAREIAFRNPNTLEAALDDRAARFRDSHPLLLLPPASLAFCAPVNLVQDVCDNRAGKEPALSATALAEKFVDGWRIDVASFDGFTPRACHEEVPLPLLPGGARTPAVSVIIPCFRQAHLLPEAVASVVAQTFTDWEIIVVDDGSPDDTAAVAEAIAAAHPDRSMRLLRKPNGGLADARNAGIAAARGAYILPLDADDLIHPTMLEKTVSLLDADTAVAIAYTDITHFGTVNRTIHAAEFDPRKIPENNQLNYCSLYRREVWERCGGYRSHLWGYEDWDFWVTCAAEGLVARRIPEPLLLYRVKESSMYTEAVRRDRELRARIVLNHPGLYRPRRVREARASLRSSPLPDTAGAPAVSVIVPTRDRPQPLLDTVRSVLAQTFDDVEIIVVNDGGIDPRPWLDTLGAGRRIRHLRHPRPRGRAAARNTGLLAARGRHVAHLDDGDLLHPEHLETLVGQALRQGAAVVSSDALRLPAPAMASPRDPGDALLEPASDPLASAAVTLAGLLVANRVPTACVLHDRGCCDVSGLFDETLGPDAEWELWIRLARDHAWAHVPRTTCACPPRGREEERPATGDPHRGMRLVHRRHAALAARHPGVRQAQRRRRASLATALARAGRPVDPWSRLRRFLVRRAA